MHKQYNITSDDRDFRKNLKHAFTLIEVLVVVAIIALLAAILLPSLSRAREQAQIAACKANCNQIGNMIATYQAEYKGFVPVLFNPLAGPIYDVPARTVFLSLALRQYNRGLENINKVPANHDGTLFDPEIVWDPEVTKPWERQDKRYEYETRFAPAHHVCPFAEGKGEFDFIELPRQRYYSSVREYKGRFESYWTWLWEGDTVRNMKPISSAGEETHPNDPREGRPKYSTFSFNYATAISILEKGDPEERARLVPPGTQLIRDARRINGINILTYRHRNWDTADAHRLKTSSLSEMTISFCAKGNFLRLNYGMSNPNSHRAGQGPGTNVIFADTHAEWVKGTRVGWF
ncbi:MAG: prepilin-type N-terminal cleavage/methylation domain-containing protein [Planctomycetota bacterium]|nr:MAG: prepilin-type N-terminal cleavage/methylation domain-containing protein [Planctomycetota bacterium]